MTEPLITVVVPSLNQGLYLDQALDSIFSQSVPLEVYLMDGGSTDNSMEVIKKWEKKLSYWRSAPDSGQAAAINEGVKLGTAPYICWLNSDDFYYPSALSSLLEAISQGEHPAVYGNCWNTTAAGTRVYPYITMPFSRALLANYCFISQPATLIRRTAWDTVGGLNENLQLAMDYDLWWRLLLYFGPPSYCSEFVAANRMHRHTKTHSQTHSHYDESISVVKKYYGKVPIKWSLMRPIMIGVRKLTKLLRSPFR